MSSTDKKGQSSSYDGFKKVGGRRVNKQNLDTSVKRPYQKQLFRDNTQQTPKEKKPQKELDQSKPFCKVCKDSGKSEEEYTNHFVRESASVDSAVVCPTLLAQSCRYCRKEGHTVKYCPALSSKFSSERSSNTKTFYNKKSSNLTKTSVSSSKKSNVESSQESNDSDIKLTTKQIMSSNPFGALHDEENDVDSENDDETLESRVSSHVNSIVAKQQWDELHSGKTLNYGDLKVKCVDGKLVFEVVKKSNDNQNQNDLVNESVSEKKQSWAQVATPK